MVNGEAYGGGYPRRVSLHLYDERGQMMIEPGVCRSRTLPAFLRRLPLERTRAVRDSQRARLQSCSRATGLDTVVEVRDGYAQRVHVDREVRPRQRIRLFNPI